MIPIRNVRVRLVRDPSSFVTLRAMCGSPCSFFASVFATFAPSRFPTFRQNHRHFCNLPTLRPA